jgi:hypothetical protein
VGIDDPAVDQRLEQLELAAGTTQAQRKSKRCRSKDTSEPA